MVEVCRTRNATCTRAEVERGPRLAVYTMALGLGLGACATPSLEDEYRAAVPSQAELTMVVPEGTSACPGGAACAALLGERAAFYQMTRETSRNVNGGVWFVMQIVRAIVEHPPSAVDGDHAAWGPWTESLSPITYVFFVERAGEGTYRYVLRGKPKAENDDAFVDLLAGETEIGAGERRGTFGLDFSAAHALDADETPEQGQLAARWEAPISGERQVEAALENFTDAEGEGPISALYRYREAVDGSGSLEFGLAADTDDEGDAAEHIVLMSRWTADGAGRGDAVLSGGDLGLLVIQASECWDNGFGRTYWNDSVAFVPTEGDASSCVYDEPLWSELEQ